MPRPVRFLHAAWFQSRIEAQRDKQRFQLTLLDLQRDKTRAIIQRICEYFKAVFVFGRLLFQKWDSIAGFLLVQSQNSSRAYNFSVKGQKKTFPQLSLPCCLSGMRVRSLNGESLRRTEY